MTTCMSPARLPSPVRRGVLGLALALGAAASLGPAPAPALAATGLPPLVVDTSHYLDLYPTAPGAVGYCQDLPYTITLAPGTAPVTLLTSYKVRVWTTVVWNTGLATTLEQFVWLPKSGGSVTLTTFTNDGPSKIDPNKTTADMTMVLVQVDPLREIAERNEANNTVGTTVLNDGRSCT